MPTLYVASYLLFWMAALVATILRRPLMAILYWPIVFLNPFSWIRSTLTFLPFGLQDVFALICLGLLAIDLPRARRSVEPGVIRGATVLLLLVLLADAAGEAVLLVGHPGYSRLDSLASVVADLRFLLPVLIVAVHVRTATQVRATTLSFFLSVIAAFCLVVADRYTPIVYDLFNHTAYISTWQDHIRRAVGGFSGPWEVGALAAMALVTALAFLSNGRLGRFAGVVVLVMTCLAAVFSESRAGLIAVAIGLAGMAVFSSWRIRWRFLLPVLTVLTVLLLLRFSSDTEWESSGVIDMVERRFDTAFSGGHLSGSAEARVDIWDRQLEWLTVGQFTGPELLFGVGGMKGSILSFQASSHSGYLGPFLYFGLPLGLLLHAALLSLLVKAIRLGFHSRNPGAAMVVVVMMASMISGEFLISSLCASVFGFLLALLARSETVARQGLPPSRPRSETEGAARVPRLAGGPPGTMLPARSGTDRR